MRLRALTLTIALALTLTLTLTLTLPAWQLPLQPAGRVPTRQRHEVNVSKRGFDALVWLGDFNFNSRVDANPNPNPNTLTRTRTLTLTLTRCGWATSTTASTPTVRWSTRCSRPQTSARVRRPRGAARR